MSDPIAMLDAEAQALYEAWSASIDGRQAAWNPFSGDYLKPKKWDRLDNHTREIWRGVALAALRSEESVLDEMRKEGRPLSVLRPTSEEPA